MKFSQILKATVMPWGMIKEMREEQAQLGRYCELPVPGESTVHLPAGEVTVTYRESTKPRHVDDQMEFDPPASLQVEVRPAAGGDPLELNTGWGESITATRGDPPWVTTKLGNIEVEDGEYTVSASASDEGRIEPTVLLG